MSRLTLVVVAVTVAGVTTPLGWGHAADLAPRDTAAVGRAGDWSLGVAAPLRYAARDGVELQAHPLLFLVAPNLLVRVAHGVALGWQLAGEYGASLPTPAMRLAQGYVFPTWDKSARRVGWFVVPRAGVVASHLGPANSVLTLRLDAAYGFGLSRNDATPLESAAPLDVLLAPALSRYRIRCGVTHDVSISERVRVRAAANVYLHGAQPSPITFAAGVGVDIGVGERSRLVLGASYWNSDTGAIDLATHEHVRSNDFFPSLDFIWAG